MTACGARIAWWRCLAAFVVVVGIVLSPLRAAAATAPMLIAHDAAAWPTATMQAETGAAVRSDERGSAPEYVYDDARDRYDGTTTRRVIDAAGGVRAYDHALNLAEQREVAEGVIYAASAAAPAAKGGGDGHHIATNKNNTSPASGGPWTPRFKAMFDRAGMSMNDADNIVNVVDHAGPHPEAYHQEVYNRLQNATAGLSGGDYASAFRGALQSIGREVATPGSPLNLLVTR